MQITLARSLKIKNRIIEELNKTTEDLIQYNRIIKDNIREVDIEETLKKINRLIDIIIDLKIKIFTAGAPIRKEIFKLSELKNLIQVYKQVSTDRGMFTKKSYLNDSIDKIEYDVILTKKEIELKIKQLQKEIDDIQFNIIDKHNNTTMIEITYDFENL